MASPYSMKPYLTNFSLILLCLLSTPSHSLSSSSAPSVYEILPKFGLPSGLLPDSVKDYTFSPEDGSFVVELENPCYVQFDYLVYYDKRITGTLKLGSITNLKGIQVKSFFLWFNVDEIKVDLPPSDSIYFQVGIISKELSIDQFQNVRSCRAGTSVSYGRRSSNIIFELPSPVDDEIPMLLTE